jgi:hypothetical protein
MKGIYVVIIAMMVACNEQPAKEKQTAAAQEVLQAPYAPQFYDSLQATMDTYYELTDGFAGSNITYADKWAGLLKGHVDSLPVGLLQMDSSRVEQVKQFQGSISAELAAMQQEKSLDEKRAGFEMISDMLYELVKTTGLRGKTVYRQYCPMAFNDRGAFWISKSTKPENPYFGNGMLGCVEVADSLRY